MADPPVTNNGASRGDKLEMKEESGKGILLHGQNKTKPNSLIPSSPPHTAFAVILKKDLDSTRTALEEFQQCETAVGQSKMQLFGLLRETKKGESTAELIQWDLLKIRGRGGLQTFLIPSNISPFCHK